GPGAHILNNIAEVNQVRRIQDVGRRGRTTGQRNPGIVVRRSTVEYVVIAVSADESVVVFREPIDAEFLVVAECQLTDHRAQRYLGRLDVHLVQNFFHLYHNLAFAEDDDGIGVLIGDELGVSDRDRLRRGVYRLRRELLGNVQRAAAAAACRAECAKLG